MQKAVKHLMMLIFMATALVFSMVGFFLSNNGVAWFSENDKATANGLSLNTTISPNLIIGKAPDELSQENLQFAVHFDGVEATDMIAVTHDDTARGTYLKCLVNHYAVDHITGNAKDGMSLEFEPVPAESEETYFVDYTVYIASAFDALDVSSLYATISMPETVEDGDEYLKAASIDFYVGEVSRANYLGTTSLHDRLSGSGRARIELMPNGGRIPLASDGYITVIMRCYFDGALQGANGNAYVNSHAVKTDGISLGVSFVGVDAVTEPEE